ncbi:hypothetical protein [Actinomadura violacea]|uniref:Uncharacterized protein n=1 Tax=Actinomadura violacea TaxID=2819934 RepID=A0ABS3RTK2_9ACTN|nr:hypothetical protein [Actinomadura violacea]MBO2459369.1 hypothetical protein [Actinomadura violacea]
MTSVPLNETAVVVLDPTGAGTASIGPISARESWHPDVISVKVSSKINEAECQIFVGDSATQPNYIDGTYSGSSGDATDRAAATLIRVGWKVFATWAGGDAAATATLTVTGTKDV